MPSRAELVLRARNVGITTANYPNDSQLEQKVIYLEKLASANTGTAAAGTLTSDATIPTDGDTVTIGGQVYTYRTALSNSGNTPYEVLIGANTTASLANLKSALAGTAGSGTTYGAGTPINADVTAGTATATTLALTATNKAYGNTVPTTETSSHLSFGAATLTTGVPSISAADTTANAGESGGANV